MIVWNKRWEQRCWFEKYLHASNSNGNKEGFDGDTNLNNKVFRFPTSEQD